MRYGELFLGIPNKDGEGGWIQAASVSGPERHPAVAWRWKRKGVVKGNVCIAAKYTRIIWMSRSITIGKKKTDQPSVMLTLNEVKYNDRCTMSPDVI